MDLDQLEQKLGYVFTDKSLLQAAFTHRSYSFEHHGENNQRMEFLGDAILDFVIADVLYHRYPQDQEGVLSKRRSRLVCEGALCQLAQALDFENYMRMGKGEISSAGMMRSGTLADAYEAVIGAIYLDGGIQPATDFILRHHANYLADPDGNWLASDDKTKLQEIVQSRHLSHRYEVGGRTGPEHAPTCEIVVFINDNPIGRGLGSCKKEAQQNAAKDALMHIHDDSQF